jgi:hypothetical protein
MVLLLLVAPSSYYSRWHLVDAIVQLRAEQVTVPKVTKEGEVESKPRVTMMKLRSKKGEGLKCKPS